MRYIPYIFFLLVNSFQLVAQVEAPRFHCIKGDSLIYTKPNNLCGIFNAFEVYGSQTRTGPYNLIGTIRDTDEFAFEHNTPDDEVWYYYMQSDFNCPGAVILSSDTLNNLPPDVSPLLSVSVENGIAVLNWEESPSPQTWGYIIYRLTDEGTIPIDTVAFSTTTGDIFANPNGQSEVYFVTAMDQCGNTSVFDKPHKSMFLETEINACSQSITLNWNLYENWEQGIDAHEIWVRKDNDIEERVEVIAGDLNSYEFQNAENGVTYAFYVNAIQKNTGINAKSNVARLDAMVVNPVGDLLVKNITFTDNDKFELEWEWNAEAELATAEIFRSFDNVSFENVANPDVRPPLDDPASYVLEPLHANEMKTYYRMNTVDLCDTATLSNYVSTIFLEGMAQPNRENLLSWTPYDSKIGTVNNYAIYKIVDGASSFLGQVAGNLTNYSDPIISVADASACYYVKADISVTFARSGLETHISRSNTTCLSQAADIVMPNAFAPRGSNQTFKPTILFGESIQNYQMVIYNRYGGKVFESTDPNTGWNGRKDGKDVPMGTYTYLVRLEQSSGESLEKGGVLMLLR